MRHILKAEFGYHKTAIKFIYSIAVLIATSTYLLRRGIFFGARINLDAIPYAIYMSFIMIPFIFLLIHIGSQQDKEKRDRLHSSLPGPIKETGFVRLVFFLLIQAGFVAIWLISVMVDYDGINLSQVSYILSFNVNSSLIIAIIFIFHDLGYFGTIKYRLVFYGFLILLLLLIVLLILFGYFIPVLKFIFEPYYTPVGVGTFTLIAGSLFYSDIVIFTRRKSYLA